MTTEKLVELRFDHKIAEFRRAVVTLRRRGVRSVALIRQMRRGAYRMASMWQDLLNNHLDELRDHAATHELSIDDFYLEAFAPMDAIGEDPRVVLAAIREGMTERVFVEKQVKGASEWLRKKLSGDNKAKHRAAPNKKPKRIFGTVEEEVEYYKQACRMLREENRAVRRRLNELEDRSEILEKALRAADTKFKKVLSA